MNNNSYILVADDDPIIQDILKIQLSDYNVECANNGKECLEKIKEVRPGLLLLDIQMPVKSGFDVLLTLHDDSEYKHFPIIFLTSTPL